MAEEAGSFLDLNLGEVPDLHTVPGDREYELKIEDATIGTSSGAKTSGQQYLLVRFSIVNEPDTKQITYPIMLPHDDLDESKNNGRKRQMKSFVQAIGFDLDSGFNSDELIGETCWAILGEKDDPEYGEQNEIKRFVLDQS